MPLQVARFGGVLFDKSIGSLLVYIMVIAHYSLQIVVLGGCVKITNVQYKIIYI